MNAVPDSVYICSRAKESVASKSLYANSKMNNFFGCDIINHEAVAISASPEEKAATTRVNPMK